MQEPVPTHTVHEFSIGTFPFLEGAYIAGRFGTFTSGFQQFVSVNLSKSATYQRLSLYGVADCIKTKWPRKKSKNKSWTFHRRGATTFEYCCICSLHATTGKIRCDEDAEAIGRSWDIRCFLRIISSQATWRDGLASAIVSLGVSFRHLLPNSRRQCRSNGCL